MKYFAVVCLFCILTACAAGPVQVAKNDTEGVKARYLDPELTARSQKYGSLLKSIYARYRLSHMALAKEGLGFTSLTDNSGKKLYYLMVEFVRKTSTSIRTKQLEKRDYGSSSSVTSSRT